ncbi:MAG: ATP synthase F1 subunit delta [Clostridia bacterium]|nr:ATP synthase F1 subunit delta [Clostridia bacterium]
MISQRAANYAKILDSLELNEQSVNKAKSIMSNCSELIAALENPVIKKQERDSVIDALFDKDICSFLKVLCDNQAIGVYAQIFEEYENILLEHKNILKAKLTYAVKPSDEELSQMKQMLCEKYKKAGVFLELKEDAALIGGFVLYVGDTEYNKSIQGALLEMQKTLIGR